DYRLHRIGAPNNVDNVADDGDGTHRYRTQSLRNITLTGPYMHAGVFDTLPQVLAFYRRRGAPPPGAPPPPNVGPLDPLFLNVRVPPQDDADIIAFLRGLQDDTYDTEAPVDVPSGLPVGGSIQ
ncbi:MAG: hypothetical protein KC620_24385, partial [Myxococcales bacterium]|nr:hypothetical protein [Myxococcales bacterium]